MSRLAQPYSPLPVLGGRTINAGLRKTLAVLEVLSGATVTALVIWFILNGGAFGGWIGLAFQSFAILSVAAGVLLWRNSVLGFELSEALQWLQVVRFQAAAFSFIAVAGPELLLIWSETGPSYYLGLHATLILGRPSIPVSYIALNLVPILMLILLRRGRLAIQAERRTQALGLAIVSRPPNEELKPAAPESSLVE